MLHEHRVLTTTQITQLAFGTTRAATARLLTLYQLRAVDRFRPLAADRVRAAALRPRRGRRAACSPPRTASPPASSATAATGPWPSPCPPSSPTPPGPTAVFCALAAAARARRRHAALDVLVVRAALRRPVGRPGPPRRLRPVDRARPRPGRPRTDFFLEYDTGTENLRPRRRQARRLPPTSPPAPASPPPSCSGCPQPAARPRCAPCWPAPPARPGRRLAGAIPGVPVATATPAGRQPRRARPGRPGCPPASPGPRLRLAQLGAPPGPAPRRGHGSQQAGDGPARPGLPWHPARAPPAAAAWHAPPGARTPAPARHRDD